MKSIDGYRELYFGNMYFVDANGEVYSKKTGKLKKLNGWIRKDGYRQYRISDITPLGHRLVAFAYFGKCPNGMEIAHFDGNPLNNAITNLRYATPKENQLDKVRHGTQLRGSQMPQSKLTENDIYEIYNMLNIGYTHKQIADKFNISRGYVANIKSGKKWAYLKLKI